MDDFDPDSYLAQKQASSPAAAAPAGFDPDAYLASKGAGAPAQVATPQPVPPNPALREQWANAGPQERLGLLLTHFGPEAVKQAKDAASHVLDAGAPAAGATLGQTVGELGGPIGALAGRAIGGGAGDVVAQLERQREGKQEGFKFGELAGTTLASALPGANLAETGGASIAKQALTQGTGGLAAKTVETEADEGRLPTAKEALFSTLVPAAGGALAQKIQLGNPDIQDAVASAEAKIATKKAALEAGRAKGLVVEPAEVNPSFANKAIESLAGSPSIRQEASRINSGKFDEMAKAVLDPTNPDIELTSEVTRAVRANAFNQGYAPVANLGKIPTDPTYANDLAGIVAARQGASRSFPGIADDSIQKIVEPLAVKEFDSGDALKAIQLLRNKASESFAAGQNETGFAARQASKAIEDQIERHLASGASSAGNLAAPQAAEMLNNFRDARQLMAQSHDVEDAIREGGGSVIPSVLAQKVQNQKPLSGDLKTMGTFANVFPKVTREAAKTPVAGTTVTGHFARGALAGVGALAGNALGSHEGAELGALTGLAIPSVRGAVRSMVLSPAYQRMMANIPVKVAAGADKSGLFLRELAQSAAESPVNKDQPEPATP